jgi:hypothetical protein
VSVYRRGNNFYIRYYGPDGRQRWETIGPNKKEAKTVLHQRQYEVRSCIYPILRRRSRITFGDHAAEWMTSYARPHVRASTYATYEWQLTDHLLRDLGPLALTALMPGTLQTFLTLKRDRLAAVTANHLLVLLSEILEAAVVWRRWLANPARGIRPFPVPDGEMQVWTLGEIRRFVLAADPWWRRVFITDLFTGLGVGELQAIARDEKNRPNFTTNKLEVSCAYNHRTKKFGPAEDQARASRHRHGAHRAPHPRAAAGNPARGAVARVHRPAGRGAVAAAHLRSLSRDDPTCRGDAHSLS